MDFKNKNIITYPIALYLIIKIFTFVSQFRYPYEQRYIYVLTFFGPYSLLSLVLLVFGLITLFVKYKFKWVLSSIPFMWIMFNPLKSMQNLTAFGYFFQSYYLINRFDFPFFVQMIVPLILLLVLLVKQFKNDVINNNEKLIVVFLFILILIDYFV